MCLVFIGFQGTFEAPSKHLWCISKAPLRHPDNMPSRFYSITSLQQNVSDALEKPQRYLRGLIGASDVHWRCLRCALDEPPRSLVPLEVSQKSLRGVLEQPWRCRRGLICTFGGALEAPGRCFRRALEAPQKCPGRAMRLNMRLHCTSEEPQRCPRGALSVRSGGLIGA